MILDWTSIVSIAAFLISEVIPFLTNNKIHGVLHFIVILAQLISDNKDAGKDDLRAVVDTLVEVLENRDNNDENKSTLSEEEKRN